MHSAVQACIVSKKKSPERDEDLEAGLARHSRSRTNTGHVHYAVWRCDFTTGERTMAAQTISTLEVQNQTVLGIGTSKPITRSRVRPHSRAVQQGTDDELSQILREVLTFSTEVDELETMA